MFRHGDMHSGRNIRVLLMLALLPAAHWASNST
jgi:hypothetical protein